jgi:GTP-binding protein
MFFDEAKIYVKSGDGGPGMMHFRREAHVPRGGPDGGDGGRGGNVILQATAKVNTLIAFSRKQRFIAGNGGSGGVNNRTGASADDLVIEVPLGTVVRYMDSEAVLADLTQPGQTFVAVKGGRGGRGNQRFVSSTNQAPRMAEKGEPGEEYWLKLELKLIADVGIVGVPNAGKSTLLSVISNARPKIASYPFTTLEPNLGVVVVGDRDIVFADIPGLVEGAHMGIGLGHAFLRHIQRTRVLVHLLNGEGENPLADFNQINAELALFDPKLGEKPQIVVFNKMDLPTAQERWAAVEAALQERGYATMSISAATQQGTQELVNKVAALIAQLPEQNIAMEIETPLYTLDESKAFTITREDDGGYRVSGAEIERAAKMTYWELDESAARFQRILAALGITKALEKAGIERGDTVYIGDYDLEWGD